MLRLITKWRKWRQLFLFVLTSILLLSLSPVFAQDRERVLVPGSTLSGALGPEANATAYVFDAAAGARAAVTAVSGDAVALALLISDSNGNTVAQAVDAAASGMVSVDDVLLTAGGRYFVVVYFAPGSAAAASVFNLTLAFHELPEAAETVPVPDASAAATTAEPMPEQILIAGGIQVSLDWTGAADMNLQVRDPSGETLYWNSRTTNNGGIFGFDANGLCEVISESPVETAAWQPGFLPTGSYEILVFYRQACDATVLSVPFSVQVTVDGVTSGSIDGILAPPRPGQDSVYVARFEVDGNGMATVHAGGVYPDSSLALLPAAFDISSNVPTAIRRDEPVVGEISNEQTFVTYSFAGTAGEVISVDMQALGPNLDTLLQIVDSRGAIISVNDDASATTNSLIENARLLNDDTYTIIATRYGKELGGTEGQFQLTLSGPANDVPLELAALQLPQGDIEVTLLWSTSADLQLLVRDPIGDAVFDDVPFSNSGGILQENGNVNCIPADTGAPVSYIYWPFGRIRPGAYEVEVWYQNACSDLPTPVEFTLVIEVAGETIAVEQRLPLVDQRFVTNFTVLPSGSATAGSGGFIDGGSQTLAYQPEILSAPTILSGQAQTGVITPSNTFDLYSFDGIAGETVTIRMSASTQTLDANLFLISPSGREIAANDDGDAVLLGATGLPTDSIISEMILPENGPYTIIATRFATQYGGTIGGYTLTMRKN